MSKLAHRRSDIEIIADILRLGEARKTEIMYSVNMSYSQLQKYLNLLLQLELVDKTLSSNQAVTCRVTAKGLRLLISIDTVLDMFEGKELVDLRY